jgi:hypothetical protein
VAVKFGLYHFKKTLIATERRVFGPEREEITGGLIILHNEELHNFYSLLEALQNDQIN